MLARVVGPAEAGPRDPYVGAGLSRPEEPNVGAGLSRPKEPNVGAGFSRPNHRWPTRCTDHRMSPDYPRHLSSFDYRGKYRYFLTFCTHGRRPYFTSGATVDLVLEQFRRAATAQHMAILAWCFMPDHLHVLVEGTRDTSSLLAFVRVAKQRAGFLFSRRAGSRLWQRHGYERVLRKDEDLFSVAAYIVANPVRAGLVRNVREYAFLGSDVYSVEELAEAAADVGRRGRTG